MSELSKEQVQTLRDAIIERLMEFELPDAMMPSRGLVRVAYDVIAAYLAAPKVDPVDAFIAALPVPDKHPAAQPVRKPLPDPDVAREKLADALAQGSAGSLILAVTKDEEDDEEADPQRATVQAVVEELKRMAMGGVMPRRVTWDNTKPADMPQAQTLLKKFGVTWTQLAEWADLRVDKVVDAPQGRAQKGYAA